jgi:hypothetical protein
MYFAVRERKIYYANVCLFQINVGRKLQYFLNPKLDILQIRVRHQMKEQENWHINPYSFLLN